MYLFVVKLISSAHYIFFTKSLKKKPILLSISNKKKNNFSYWVKKVHSKNLQRKHNLKFYLYIFIIII